MLTILITLTTSWSVCSITYLCDFPDFVKKFSRNDFVVIFVRTHKINL